MESISLHRTRSKLSTDFISLNFLPQTLTCYSSQRDDKSGYQKAERHEGILLTKQISKIILGDGNRRRAGARSGSACAVARIGRPVAQVFGGVCNIRLGDGFTRMLDQGCQMKRFIEGEDRNQVTLLPECLGTSSSPRTIRCVHINLHQKHDHPNSRDFYAF